MVVMVHSVYLMTHLKVVKSGRQDDAVGQSPFLQTWQPKLPPRDSHGGWKGSSD